MAKKFIFVNTNADYEESPGAYESSEFLNIREVGASAQNWARTLDVVTITSNAHGLSDGNTINITVSSDTSALPLGTYKITYIGVNSFSVVGVDAGASSGTATYTAGIAMPVKTNASGYLDTSFMSADVVLIDGSHSFTGIQKYATAQIFGTDRDLVDKGYVDQAVIGAGQIKESLLADEQMNDAQGILALEAFWIVTGQNAQVNDTFVVSNGTTTETWTFKASRTGAFEVAIGADNIATMTNLQSAITTDSTAWGSEFYTSELDSMNTDGVVVVWEKTTASGISTSRIYGVWGTQANAEVVEFNGTKEYYTSKASITLPSSDPGAGRFGLRRQKSALTNGEIHLDIAHDQMWTWNEDGQAWYLLSAGVVPQATAGAGGAIKGKWTADYYKGLDILSGVGEVRVDGSTINFTAGSGTYPTKGKLEVPAGGITETQINSSTLTAELTGGSGSKIGISWATSPWNTNKAIKDSDLKDSATATKGAVMVGLYDVGGYTSQTDVEGAIQEIYSMIGNQGQIYTSDAVGVTKADLVYISANNTVKKLPITGAGSGNWGIGLAITTVGGTLPVKISEKSGVVLTGVLTGATFGTRYYWNGSGLSTSPSSTGGAYVWMVGIAKNATDLTVDIQFLKKNA